jgi:hypothetical protein
MFFYTKFLLPGSDDRLDLEIRAWRSPTRTVMRSEHRTTADVYEDLARRSLNMFLRRYLKRVLRDPPDVSVPALVLPDAQEEKDERDDKDDKEEDPTAAKQG